MNTTMHVEATITEAEIKELELIISESDGKSDDTGESNCTIDSVSKRFIIEVFLNGRRLEYRASDSEMDFNKELIELKRTYKCSDCKFYKGELNVC